MTYHNAQTTDTLTGELRDDVLDFIRAKTTIDIKEVRGECHGEWDGCEIVAGTVFVSLDSPPQIGDFLHEIGHVATTPYLLRQYMSGDLSGGFLEMCCQDQPDPLGTMRVWSDDNAATCWGLMVCRALSIDGDLMFRNGYDSMFAPWGPSHTGFQHYQEFSGSNRNRFSVAAYHLGLSPKAGLPFDRWEVQA